MNKTKGFTLVELMVVIAIIGVIMAYAIPSYKRYVIRTQRVDAQNILIELSEFQEKHKIVYNQYANNHLGTQSATELGLAGKYQETDDYVFTIDGANGYTFSATAKPTSIQNEDAFGGIDCTTITLNSLGVKTLAACWQ